MKNFQSLLTRLKNTFCNMNGIVCSYNVSNDSKNLHINAQNLDGLSEKSDWASISGASPRKELLLELIKSLNLRHMIFINRFIN